MAAKKRKAKKKKSKKSARSKKADRARVSGKQRHEVYYLARKHGVSAEEVRDTIKRVGNLRKNVDAALAAK